MINFTVLADNLHGSYQYIIIPVKRNTLKGGFGRMSKIYQRNEDYLDSLFTKACVKQNLAYVELGHPHQYSDPNMLIGA